MILKEKDAYSGADSRGTDTRGFYGHKQEQDVAFHLRREFGEHDQIHVINDLALPSGGAVVVSNCNAAIDPKQTC